MDLSKPENYVIETVVKDEYGNTTTILTDYEIKSAPHISIKPEKPGELPIIPLLPDGPDVMDKDGHVHREYSDYIVEDKVDEKLTLSEVEEFVLNRYDVPDNAKVIVKMFDKDKKPITQLDKSIIGQYYIEITVEDEEKNTSDIHLVYEIKEKSNINIDTNGDGKPAINIDTDGDGKPDLNIDTDGDGKPDLNIDTDGDGKPDLNIDTNSDGEADLNIDTNGDGKADLNVDIDNDGKPDLNIDTDGDGKPDLNLDRDGDGKIDAEVNGEDVKTPEKVKTGDDAPTMILALMALSSLSMVVLLFLYKKQLIENS